MRAAVTPGTRSHGAPAARSARAARPTPLCHVFLTSADSGFLKDDVVLYANSPLAAATTYRVQIDGTYVGGTLALDWTFTTK